MHRLILHFVSCLWMAAGVSLLLFTPGLVIYFNNPDQFNIGLGFLLTTFAIAVLSCTFVMAILLGILHKITPQGAHAIGFACCINIFLQYHAWSELFVPYLTIKFFSWDFLFFVLLFIVIMGLPFVLAWRFRAFIAEHIRRLFLVVLCTQLVAVAHPLLHYKEPNYDFKSYAFTETDKFTFGQKENIIIMVVDCMGEGICKEVLEKYPDLKDSLRDFTCFDRMISPLPWTMYAVPAMMTGVDFPRKEYGVPGNDDHSAYLREVCMADTSLFRALKTIGFRTEGYPFLLPTISYAPEVLDNSVPQFLSMQKVSIMQITEILSKKLCPFFLASLLPEFTTLPFLTFDRIDADGLKRTYDQQFLHRLQNECRIGKYPAVFKYLHLQGAHETVLLDENLKRNRNHLQYKQLRGSLRNFEQLLQKLKTLGIYDKSTILLVGDHTECYEIQNIAFVKRKHETHEALRFNSIPCQVSDIAGTVLKEYSVATELPSLYDQPPIWGDGAVRPEQVRYADFTPFEPCSQLPELNEYGTICRMQFDGDAFILENFIDERKIVIGTEVTLFLTQLDSDKNWKARLDYSQRFPCLRTTLDNLPDGEYQIQLFFYGKDEKGEIQQFHAFGLRELRVSHGKAEFLN